MSRVIMFACVTLCAFTAHATAATHRWISVTGDFNSSSSWSTSKAPSQWTAADDVLFDGPSQLSVTTGLDQGAVTVRGVTFTSNYHGTIGQFGTPLRIIARQVSHSGTGKLYFDAPQSLTLCTILVGDPSQLTSPEPHAYLSGAYYQVIQLGGTIDLLPAGTAHRLIVTPRNLYYQHISILGVDAPSPDEIFTAGDCRNDRRLTAANTIYLAWGYLYQNGLIEDGATINSFHGEFVYSPVESDIVTHPILNLMGDGPDFSNCFHENGVSPCLNQPGLLPQKTGSCPDGSGPVAEG